MSYTRGTRDIIAKVFGKSIVFLLFLLYFSLESCLGV